MSILLMLIKRINEHNVIKIGHVQRTRLEDALIVFIMLLLLCIFFYLDTFRKNTEMPLKYSFI